MVDAMLGRNSEGNVKSSRACPFGQAHVLPLASRVPPTAESHTLPLKPRGRGFS